MIDPGFEPHQCLLACMLEENDLATMLTTKRSEGATLEVNLRECETCMPPQSANKALKPKGDFNRSPKQRYQ